MLRCALSALALLFLLVPPGVAQKTAQAKTIGKRMMCLCSCNQILTECNHVGCQVSAEMLAKLDQQVSRNEPEDLTIQAFVQEYGQKVLALPPSQGFGRVAWITPVVAGLAGLVVVGTMLLRWRRPASAVAGGGISPEILARARREAERESEE